MDSFDDWHRRVREWGLGRTLHGWADGTRHGAGTTQSIPPGCDCVLSCYGALQLGPRGPLEALGGAAIERDLSASSTLPRIPSTFVYGPQWTV